MHLYHLSEKYLCDVDHVVCGKDCLVVFHEEWLVYNDGHVFLTEQSEPYRFTLDEGQEKEEKCFSVGFTGKSTEAVAVKEEDFPLTIRSAEAGDAIVMRYGTKKVHRFFIDRHIPLYMRKRWPVVVNRKGNIILVPGLGCDVNHYRQHPSFFVHVKSD